MANITRFDPFNDIRRINPFLDVNDFFKGFAMHPLMREFEREPHNQNRCI